MATEKFEELMREYRRLAKRADQRLVRIERYAGQREAIKGEKAIPGMEKLTSYAYRKALWDIKKWSGAEAKRFNTAPPNNTNQLKAKIADIRNFLESDTSRVTTTRNIYQKRVDTINEKYGTSFTWEQFGEFMNSKLYEKLSNTYYLAEILRAFGVIQQNKKQIKDALTNRQPVHIQLSDEKLEDGTVIKKDLILEENVNNILSEYGLEIKKLL